MGKLRLVLLLFVLVVALASGCGNKKEEAVPFPAPGSSSEITAPGEPAPRPEKPSEPKGSEPAATGLKPNEAGKIMVLMYHSIGYPEAEWTRTPENFRQDLQALYSKGYRLVDLMDYANGKIDLPKGYSPVIITFDDGTQGQFNFVQHEGKWRVDPKSAVGIIEGFAQEHPEFGTAATFYTNYPVPFRQPEHLAEKYRLLAQKGMAVGNHTYNHERLDRLSDEQVRAALGRHQEQTQKIMPGYEVQSLALPFGIWPKNKALAVSGEYNGIKYHNRAVLLVGSSPAPSPYTAGFDAQAIPRVRGSDPYLTDWLNYFEKQPQERYISDGKLDTVTVLPGKETDLEKDKTSGVQVITGS